MLAYIAEIDPICALQAAMEGYEVLRLEDIVDKVDIVVTATGNYHVLTHEHTLHMKSQVIVCNIGHLILKLILRVYANIPGKISASGRDRCYFPRW